MPNSQTAAKSENCLLYDKCLQNLYILKVFTLLLIWLRSSIDLDSLGSFLSDNIKIPNETRTENIALISIFKIYARVLKEKKSQ